MSAQALLTRESGWRFCRRRKRGEGSGKLVRYHATRLAHVQEQMNIGLAADALRIFLCHEHVLLCNVDAREVVLVLERDLVGGRAAFKHLGFRLGFHGEAGRRGSSRRRLLVGKEREKDTVSLLRDLAHLIRGGPDAGPARGGETLRAAPRLLSGRCRRDLPDGGRVCRRELMHTTSSLQITV